MVSTGFVGGPRRAVHWVLAVAILGGCAGEAAGDDGGGGDAGGGGDGFQLDYRSGPAALLDLRVLADLDFTGVEPTLPVLSPIGVAQAHATVFGDGQQWIELGMSTANELEVGDRFSVLLEFSRANDGPVLDGGGTLTMGCNLDWSFADDTSFGLAGDCDVTRSSGGYAVTIVQASDESTAMSGTLTFAPVPNEPVAYTPGDGCPSDQICLSLDPEDYEPKTGYCLPTTSLKSHALPCSAECSAELRIQTGGEEICVCTAACGTLDQGGGGDPPTCDPAYGCIDF